MFRFPIQPLTKKGEQANPVCQTEKKNISSFYRSDYPKQITDFHKDDKHSLAKTVKKNTETKIRNY